MNVGGAPIRIRAEGDGVDVGGTAPGAEFTGTHAVFIEIQAVALLLWLEHIPVRTPDQTVVRQLGVLPIELISRLDIMML